MTKTNHYKNFDFKEAQRLIRLALKEDKGSGDITSELLIPDQSKSKAEILVKENGIIAGLRMFELVFKIIDKKVKVKFNIKDGDPVRKGLVIGYVTGSTKSLLLGERTALNIFQRMSGIATLTDKMRKKLQNERIKIIDTRKTTPNFRIFEKLAVLMGGGANHRFGLYDMVLIKDNHIEANGGISNTIEVLKQTRRKIRRKIEIEVKDIKELEIVISEGIEVIDRVLLDNFKIQDVKKAALMNSGLFELEVSGGIDENNINLYKGLEGIDFISIGSLTHSVNSLDISFNFIT